MSIELMYKVISNKNEISKLEMENLELEKKIATYLANDFLPIKERLVVFLGCPVKRFNSSYLSDLPPIIKFVAEVYSDTFIDNLSCGDEVDLKGVLTKIVLNYDGSYKKDFLDRNNIAESDFNREINFILKNNYTNLIYD